MPTPEIRKEKKIKKANRINKTRCHKIARGNNLVLKWCDDRDMALGINRINNIMVRIYTPC